MADFTPAHLRDWIQGVIGTSQSYAYGEWVDRPDLKDKRIVAIAEDGGAAPLMDVRRQRFRVLLLSKAEGRSDVMSIRADAQALINAAWEMPPPECAAYIAATGAIVGPGFTTDDRAWFDVRFDVIF